MTSHDSFFQQKQPAAVLKHALLREYTKVFASVVGSQDRTRPVWVIDGYAGAGAYEEPDPEGAHPDGSPLIVLKMAEEFKSRQVIKSIFIESDTSAVEALDKNVTPFRDRGLSATILNGTVEEQMPSAWSAVGTNPVVTFLDPFGVAMRRETMTGLLLHAPVIYRPRRCCSTSIWRQSGGSAETWSCRQVRWSRAKVKNGASSVLTASSVAPRGVRHSTTCGTSTGPQRGRLSM